VLAGNGPWSEVFSFNALPTITTIIQPQYGEMLNSNNVTVIWKSLRGATSYRVVLDYNGYWQNREHLGEFFTQDTTFTFDELVYQKIYAVTIWGVAGDLFSAFAASKVKFSIGEVPLIPNPPSVIYPQNSATDIELLPQFKWHSPLGSVLHWVKVSKDSLFNSTIFHQGMSDTTFTYISSLEYDTKYFWQLRSEGMLGDMGSWSPVYSFTTTTNVPKLLYPINNAIDVNPEFYFSWHRVDGAINYLLQVSSDIEFNNIIIDEEGIVDTSLFCSSLNLGQNYFWRVKSMNQNSESPWSEIWSFKLISQLDQPQLLYPINNSYVTKYDIAFIWYSVENASDYQIQVATNSTFTSLLYNVNISDTSITIPEMSQHPIIYWRIRATAGNHQSPWSEIWSFHIIEPLQTPQLISPQNLATDVNPEFYFSWHRVDEAINYTLQVSSDIEFNNIIIDEERIVDTSLFCHSLNLDQNYFWRVKSMNQNSESPWSEIWSFKLISQLDQPQLLYPIDYAIDVNPELTFVWNKINFANNYQLQVSQVPTFESPAIDRSDIIDSTYFSNILESASQYFWRVKAIRFGSIGSAWSDVFNFSTKSAFVSSPILSEPSNNSSNVNINPTFKWYPVENYQSYHFQISRDSSFNTVQIDSMVNDTQITINNLREGEKYYWHVRVSENGNINPWSSKWDFITMLSKPNNLLAIQVGSTVVLEWEHETEGLMYLIERKDSSTSPSWIDSVFNYYTYIDSTISNNQTYIYTVNAKSTFALSDDTSIQITVLITSVEDSEKPSSFSLSQNFPNPFNPSTTISFSLSHASDVKLKLFDLIGKEVAELVNSKMSAGTHELKFNAENLASGIYIYKLITPAFTDTKKMMFVK